MPVLQEQKPVTAMEGGNAGFAGAKTCPFILNIKAPLQALFNSFKWGF